MLRISNTFHVKFSRYSSKKLFHSIPPAYKQTVSDITIIGGGPAGLTMAAALKSNNTTKNLKITLVESTNLKANLQNFIENKNSGLFTNRIVSLTAQSINYLDNQVKAWKYIDEGRIQDYSDIIAYDGLSNAKIEFDSEQMGTMCENINLQAALFQRIQETNTTTPENTVDIIDNTKVTDISRENPTNINSWPILTLSNNDTIKTRLLVGADGFNSPVRKFSGIQSRGWFYNRWGVVATLDLKYEDFRTIAWQRFLPTGPLALLPLPEKKATIVWSTTPELSNLLLKLPEKVFTKLLNCAFVLPQVDLEYYYKMLENSIQVNNYDEFIDDANWRLESYVEKNKESLDSLPLEIAKTDENSRAKFPLKLSHADSYVDTRIALVGDAAHTTHPLAGQGLNMGQADVKSLVESIEKGMNRGLDIGSKLCLEPYFSERYVQNHILLGIVDKLHKIYSIEWQPIVSLRSIGLDAINYLPFVKDFMIKQISGK